MKRKILSSLLLIIVGSRVSSPAATPTYRNLADAKLNSATAAYNQVRLLLGKADAALIKADINSQDKTESTRFATWFGPYTAANIDVVKKVVHTMVLQLDSSRPLVVDGAGPLCAPGIVAYVLVPPGGGGVPGPPGPGGVPVGRVPGIIQAGLTVNLCQAFFTAPLLGHDSQVGTIIHEISHLIANTDDVPNPAGGAYPDGFTETYGETNCKWLAQNHPGLARANADNYLFYCCSFPLK